MTQRAIIMINHCAISIPIHYESSEHNIMTHLSVCNAYRIIFYYILRIPYNFYIINNNNDQLKIHVYD